MLWRGIKWLGLTLPLMALTPLPGPFSNFADGPGIQFAEYQVDLDSYPHRIMGSIREKDRLYVLDANANAFAITLSHSNPGHVFEDVKPYVGDVDGDGFNDVSVIETSLSKGASLAIYSIQNGALRKIAQTPFIGRRNRWFAQMGIGDFNQDGQPDVAYVDRPHLARVIRIHSFVDGSFQEIAAAGGITNHAIGDEIIWGGTRTCNGRDELIAKNQSTGTYMALWIKPNTNQITGRDLGIAASIPNFPQALTC